MRVPITNRCPDLPLPTRASSAAAGLDLRAAVEETIILLPGARILVPTGIAAAIPAGFEGQVRPRSGLAIRNGITLLNSPGTIDADYRGEISVIVINHGQEPFEIRRGDRIAQLVFAELSPLEVEHVAELPVTERGAGGFGSSGTS